MTPRSSRGRAAIALLALICAAPGYAAQTKVVRDGVAVEAVIAASEPTRIRVQGAKIKDVVGNIYSSTCTGKDESPVAAAAPAVNPQGEFVLGCDLDKGEIYISPVPLAAVPAKPPKPINLFISTEKATYTLRLHRSELPADTIVLVDNTATGAALPRVGRSPQHVRALKEMLMVMVGARGADDVTTESVNQEQLLWREARMVLQRRFRGRNLVGEEYRLTNVTDRPLVLAEQEFDRPGAQVLAVSIDNLNLLPHESTAVYVIRSGD